MLLELSKPWLVNKKMTLILNCVLCCLWKDHESRQEVHKLGGIQPLLELLNSDFPVIQHLALKTLEKVTTDENTLLTFREDKGLEKLMNILSNAVRMCGNALCFELRKPDGENEVYSYFYLCRTSVTSMLRPWRFFLTVWETVSV